MVRILSGAQREVEALAQSTLSVEPAPVSSASQPKSPFDQVRTLLVVQLRNIAPKKLVVEAVSAVV